MTSVPLRSELFVAPAAATPPSSIKPLVDPTQPPRAQAQEDKRRKVCVNSDWDDVDIANFKDEECRCKSLKRQYCDSRCADVKKWLPSTRFLWLTCPQRWNILLSHTFLITILPACLGKCHHNSNLKGWHSWGLRLQPLWVHQQGISIKVKNSIILPISADKLLFYK